MNKNNNIAGPVDYRGQPLTLAQQTRERAQRLYMAGELNMAAQLLLALAAGSSFDQTQGGGDAING